MVWQGYLKESSKNKGAGGCHFPAPLPSLDLLTPVGTSTEWPLFTQLSSSAPHPPALFWTSPLRLDLRGSPNQCQVSSHGRPAQTLLTLRATPLCSPMDLAGIHPKQLWAPSHGTPVKILLTPPLCSPMDLTPPSLPSARVHPKRDHKCGVVQATPRGPSTL